MRKRPIHMKNDSAICRSRKGRVSSAILVGLALLFMVSVARAQWVSQTYDLNPGWNAIWVPMDCTQAKMEDVFGGKNIESVIRWNPYSSDVQYIADPSHPISQDQEWAFWPDRGPLAATLNKLTGNSAYLVKSKVQQSLTLKGKPLLQTVSGNIKTGQCLTGFPVSPAKSGKVKFSQYFSYDAVLANITESSYHGGGDNIDNWIKLVSSVSSIKRGAAYWIRSADYTPYYGPVRVLSSDGAGLDFGTSGTAKTLTLRNATNGASKKPITVTASPVPSEQAPSGQAPVAGQVPLYQAALNPQSGQMEYSPFSAYQRVLQPGEEVTLTLYLDRMNMGKSDGLVYQGLVKVADDLGLTEIIVPVRAVSTSPAGLWIGEASINKVGAVSAPDANPEQSSDVPFKQRIILFVDDAGKATLLQQVYIVPGPAKDPVAMTYNSYNKTLTTNPPEQNLTNRISSATLPLDFAEEGAGTLSPGSTTTFTVLLPFDAATNPFVHSYHPQHDNLDPSFQQKLPEGQESYTITRSIELRVSASPAGSFAPGWGADILSGTYMETISGLKQQNIKIQGEFALHRISMIKTLQK